MFDKVINCILNLRRELIKNHTTAYLNSKLSERNFNDLFCSCIFIHRNALETTAYSIEINTTKKLYFFSTTKFTRLNNYPINDNKFMEMQMAI